MNDETLKGFLLARITEDQIAARRILYELERTVAEDYAGMSDEHGPMTPSRLLSAQLWALYDGQTRSRNFAKGQYLATMADPARVLAECEAKVRLIEANPKKASILRPLAMVYASHPNYRDEWKL